MIDDLQAVKDEWDEARKSALTDVVRCLTELGADVPEDVVSIVQLVADQNVSAQRAGYKAALQEAAGVCDAVESEWKDTDFSEPHRSLARGAVMGATECRDRINALLVAAPAAEVK